MYARVVEEALHVVYFVKYIPMRLFFIVSINDEDDDELIIIVNESPFIIPTTNCATKDQVDLIGCARARAYTNE